MGAHSRWRALCGLGRTRNRAIQRQCHSESSSTDPKTSRASLFVRPALSPGTAALTVSVALPSSECPAGGVIQEVTFPDRLLSLRDKCLGSPTSPRDRVDRAFPALTSIPLSGWTAVLVTGDRASINTWVLLLFPSESFSQLQDTFLNIVYLIFS